jgi:hypothetical protein
MSDLGRAHLAAFEHPYEGLAEHQHSTAESDCRNFADVGCPVSGPRRDSEQFCRVSDIHRQSVVV